MIFLVYNDINFSMQKKKNQLQNVINLLSNIAEINT